jgi:phenylpyruvate tautomerase PptA (4-oxalocrotonate tautomerase family)
VAIARIDVVGRRRDEERRRLVLVVREAIVEALQVPADDPTVQLVELDPACVLRPFDASERYTLVTITMFAGRSLEAKRRLYEGLTNRFVGLGVPREEIDIVLHEPPLECWARGGVPAFERDIPFDIDV